MTNRRLTEQEKEYQAPKNNFTVQSGIYCATRALDQLGFVMRCCLPVESALCAATDIVGTDSTPANQ